MQQAKNVYASLKELLQKKDFSFDANDEDMTFEFFGRGEDLPMGFLIRIDEKRKLVVLYSNLPFQFSQEQIVAGALGTLIINDSLVDGSFDFDIFTGRVCFRLTNTFRDSVISEEAFDSMLDYAICAVDKYNDKLFMLNSNLLTPEQFVEAIS